MPDWMRYQNGVLYNCSDQESDFFAKGKNISQTESPWADNNKYARWTAYYLIVVIFIVMVHRMVNYLTDYGYHNSSRPTYAGVVPIRNRLTALLRLVGYRRLPAIVGSILQLPSSVGSCLLILAGWLYLLLICFVPHPYYRVCRGFGSPPLAVRAGMMANALTPFIYAFSGKTNVVTMLTGVSYERLQVFHQTVAWMSLFFAWVHTIPFFLAFVWEGGSSYLHSEFVSDVYYVSGTVALVMLCILTFFSVRAIRNMFYELFLHIHWPIGIAYLGVLWWHDDNALESWGYMWASLAVFGAGLLYRFFQKTNYLQLRGTWFRTDMATLRVLDDSAVEITVFTPTIASWTPGQHVFIRFLSIQPLGNHPFSLASIPEVDKESGYTKLRFVVRPYTGFTRMLYKMASTKVDASYSVLLDGPYGGVDRDVTSFDTVVLCASGSGSTAVVPFLSYLSKIPASSMRVKTIRLLWVIRHVEAFDWFKKEIDEAVERATAAGINVEARVHVTQTPAEQVDNNVSSKDNKIDDPSSPIMSKECSSTSTLRSSCITFHHGRPDIRTLLNEWSNTFSNRTIVVSAGIEGVRNAVSWAVANLQTKVLSGKADEIYLHTEDFGW
uniref:ferric-chelate reductase (NADPH) n=1 Tax=Blastobotrys adeninivorans TaxID=409370 RepID=A0A060T4X6_BLAAD